MGSIFEGPQVASPVVNTSLNNLNGRDVLGGFGPVNLNAGGIRSRFQNGTVSLGSGRGRNRIVNRLMRESRAEARELGRLRRRVRPGFSDLRKARLQELGDRQQAAVGDLRDNLSRRRVLGSSFAGDAENRANLAFAREADSIQAETFLQELDATNRLIGQQFDARRNAFATKLADLNLQADLASRLTSDATKALTAGAEFRTRLASLEAELQSKLGIAQAEQDAQAQEGAGSFFGKALGIGLAPFTGGASLGLGF